MRKVVLQETNHVSVSQEPVPNLVCLEIDFHRVTRIDCMCQRLVFGSHGPQLAQIHLKFIINGDEVLVLLLFGFYFRVRHGDVAHNLT